jgi:DNA primase
MSDVEKIKQRLDIVDVISKYIELKQAGSNYKALCPFHGEKTPSFSVNSQLQIYKCFGCGKTGDVINFVQEIERLTFPEALGKTAEMAGVEIEGKFQHKDLASEEKKFRALQATGLAAKYFHHVLMAHEVGKHAREYADKRLLTSKELTKFNFGYATNSYVNLKSFLLERGFSEDELIEFGLLVKREKSVDKFRNRLMQPLYNLEGKVIGFSGRILVKNDKAPKYLNSPESILYKKNEQLYSLFHAKEAIRKQGFVILVEGNLDVVSSHRVGVENIVAPLGTAFTPNQAKLIKRFSDKVYICFDTDKAGIGATGRTLKILEDEGIEHRVIDLGEYQDCDEMIRAGAKLWIKAIENNMETYEYLKQALTKDIDLGSADAKTQIKKLIMPIIQSYKGDVKINHYVRDLSLILEVSQESLINELGNNIKKRPSFFDKEESVENTKENIDAKPTEADKLEEVMLSMIISNPELIMMRFSLII